MRPRYWLLTTIAMVAIAVGAIAALNIALDIYGLYRPVRGRHLPVVGDARVSKYLLSMRYVPENFNAMLIGASISANWDVTGIERLRVYNASLNGGNIAEERMLVEAALERPGISVVLLVVHPAVTYSHEFRTVEMKPSLKLSSLGSLSLWNAYKDMLNIRLGRLRRAYDYCGTETFFNARSEMNVHMKKMWNAPDFTVDPIADQAFREHIAKLRAHGIKIVFIVPPTSEELLRTKRAPLQRYTERIRSEVGSGDLWIDFLKPQHDAFCRTRSNFFDGVHVTTEGARYVVAHINAALKAWMADSKVRVAQR